MAYKPLNDEDQQDQDPIAQLIKQAMVNGGTAQDPNAPPDDVQTNQVEPTIATPPGTGISDKPEDPNPSQVQPNYKFKDKLNGFSMDKFDDPNHKSPKYQIARTLAQFDPSQGITPEVLDALNKLGIGQFSGSGDKVNIANGDPAFDGVTSFDAVQDYGPGGKNLWTYQTPDAGGDQGQGSGGGLGLDVGGLIGSLNAGVPTDDNFFQTLLNAARNAAGGNTDRKSLLSLMGLG